MGINNKNKFCYSRLLLSSVLGLKDNIVRTEFRRQEKGDDGKKRPRKEGPTLREHEHFEKRPSEKGRVMVFMSRHGIETFAHWYNKHNTKQKILLDAKFWKRLNNACGVEEDAEAESLAISESEAIATTVLPKQSENSSAITLRQYNGIEIPQRPDGYINATKMCQAGSKKWNDFWRLKSLQDYINALASVTGIPATDLVTIVQGGEPQLQGTWIHPRLASRLAQWISPEFAVVVDGWVIEIAEGRHPMPNEFSPEGAIAKNQAALMDVCSHHAKQLDRLEDVVFTGFTHIKEGFDSVNSRLDKLEEIHQQRHLEIQAALVVLTENYAKNRKAVKKEESKSRKNFGLKTKRQALNILTGITDGHCLLASCLGQRELILDIANLDDLKEIEAIEYHHIDGNNSNNSLENCLPVHPEWHKKYHQNSNDPRYSHIPFMWKQQVERFELRSGGLQQGLDLGLDGN